MHRSRATQEYQPRGPGATRGAKEATILYRWRRASPPLHYQGSTSVEMSYKYYTLESFKPEMSVGFLIKRCGALMSQIAERQFESLPISFTQWTIMIRLAQSPHATPTDLSSYTGHDMGALTRMVDELERKALVRRQRSRQDRRAVQIAITPEGRRLVQVGKRIIVNLLNGLLEPYSKTDVDALISLLQRLLRRMQQDAGGVTSTEVQRRR